MAIQPGLQGHGLHDRSCAQGERRFLEQLVCIHNPAVVSVLWPSPLSPRRPGSQGPQVSIAGMGSGSRPKPQQPYRGYCLVPSSCTLSTGQSTQKGTPWYPGPRPILLWERRGRGREEGGSSVLTRDGLSCSVLLRAEEPAGTYGKGEEGPAFPMDRSARHTHTLGCRSPHILVGPSYGSDSAYALSQPQGAASFPPQGGSLARASHPGRGQLSP